MPVRSFSFTRLSAALAVVLVGLVVLLPASALGAQDAGVVRVTVQGADGQPLAAASVMVAGTSLGALTDREGRATLANVPAGRRELRVDRPGFAPARAEVDVPAGGSVEVSVRLTLAPERLSGIQVTVLRPDLRPEAALGEAAIREANPHDIGAVFRQLPGLDAMRRGGLGLDPVVRGLRDTQVGAYVDGMRTLPGGPAGMDTPLSHVDPSAIRELEVVKGPYALTWGAGNLSAVRVGTRPLPPPGAAGFSGRAFVGHDTNLGASEGGLEVAGVVERVGYTLSGAWRESGDYTSGAGVLTPSGFRSGELRGRIGLPVSPTSTLELSGWTQVQRDIDYPGRPLDADWFDTYNVALRWQLEPRVGRVRSLEAQAYRYVVDHGMNNDRKPTALPNPDRMPPFALDIETLSSVEMWGGRMATVFGPGTGSGAEAWEVEVGVDGYTAFHQAASTNRNRETGVILMERLIWGDVNFSTAGAFARLTRPLGDLTATGTLRLDHVRADADSVSAFFQANATADPRSRETTLSGAMTLALPLGAHWTVAAGAGSVVRTADPNERFSDRAPSKRAQIGAEFVGDPGLRPERSQQIDLWTEATFARWRGSLNLFVQQLDDAITIERTELPRQSPMSAPTVFRYVNGEARYLGAEAEMTLALAPAIELGLAGAWLRGEDRTLNEPALGVTPLRLDAALRWQPTAEGAFAELSGRSAARQSRVSTTRGETATDGYTTLDLQGGYPLPGGVFLRAGVQNLLDAEVVNHLNARNPFTGSAVPEPGRVFFVRASVSF